MRDVYHLMVLLALKENYEAVVVSLHSPSQTHSALLKWEIPTTVSNASWNRQLYLQEHAVCLHQLLAGTEKKKQEQSYSSVGASVYFGIFHEETCQGSKPFLTTRGATWKTALMEKVWVSLGPEGAVCFAFSGLKKLLCMLSAFLSVLFSGSSRTVQFDSKLSSSLDNKILKILLWIPV